MKRYVFSICILLPLLVIALAQPATACFGERVECENVYEQTFDGGAVDYEYYEIFPQKHQIYPGSSYTYVIEVTYYNWGCEVNGVDLKLQTIANSVPSGWTWTLTDSAGNDVDGVQMFKPDQTETYYYYLEITAPTNAQAGDSANITVRTWMNGTRPPNEHNTIDVTVEIEIIAVVPELPVFILPAASIIIIFFGAARLKKRMSKLTAKF